MKRILYVIWWEGIKKNGLIENVVYRHLEALADQTENDVFFLSGGPFWKGSLFRFLEGTRIGRVLLKNKPNNWIVPGEIKARFAKSDIKTFFAQSFGNPKSVYLHFFQLLFYPFPHLWQIHHLHKKYDIEIIHCRSYFPAWISLLSRSLFRDSYAIIFDARGLIPEEGVCTNHFTEKSLSFKLWKRVEKKLLTHSDAVVNLNSNFHQHLKQERGEKLMRTIYIPVDLKPFTQIGKTTPKICEPVPTLVYLGAISSDGWNSIEYLAEFFHFFQNSFPAAKLLIIAPGHHEYINQTLISLGIPEQLIIIKTASSLEEVASEMQSATYACLPFREIRHRYDHIIGATKISCKLCEYLAAGIPVLCNKDSKGDADFIEAHGVGEVFSMDEIRQTPCKTLTLPSQDPEIANRCRKAAELFEISHIARQVTKLYNDIPVKSEKSS